MKVIVLGEGFLGKKFKQEGFEVWGKDKFSLFPSNLDDIWKLSVYDAVINCIGKSNTRWCENPVNFEEAFFSNAVVPGLLSDFCKTRRKKFIHVSTGCLYDRNDVPQKETNFLSTHCIYTATKLIGEKRCSPEDLILRPRLYFSDSLDRNNLLCKLPKFTNFVDELNSYTSLDTIVNATGSLIGANASGIFNVACQGYASLYDIAGWIGLNGEKMSAEELRKKEGLYLVNNTMDLTKLNEYYEPPKLKDEVLRCWTALQSAGDSK